MSGGERVEAFIDGACSGNPGVGGWGCVLRWRGHEKEVSGAEAHTTNNRMELRAAIGALEALKARGGGVLAVEMVCDSTYVRNGVTLWLPKWRARGWRLLSGGGAVKNQDLWRRLEAALVGYDVVWRWVKGHAGHEGNERADRLAREALARLRAR